MRIKWNPYPQTMPPKSGRYIVTFSEKTPTADYRRVDFDLMWSSKHHAWNATDNEEVPKYEIKSIIAWAKKPSVVPYMVADGDLPVERLGATW